MLIIVHIVVRGVDEEVFNKFKEWAAEGGIPLGKAITMAIEMWLHEKEQEAIAQRMVERSRKGLYKLPKDWKFKRDEIYDRG